MSKEREALKLLVHEMEYVLSCINKNKLPFDGDDFHEALRLGKEVLTQPEFVLNGVDCSCGRKWRIVNNTLKASAQPEQEPAAIDAKMDDVLRKAIVRSGKVITPQNNPQRTWVGLTEEERHSAYFDKDGMALDCYDEYAWAIEAKLKEKNT